MDELLKVKEVQDLLKVDRLTVYRMLKDGRLSGRKIGHQWRFRQADVNHLLSVAPTPRPAYSDPSRAQASEALPLHCVQLIQGVFADIAEIGAITVTPSGEPLTEMSNSCTFCNLIQSNKKGMTGCMASWRRLSERDEAGSGSQFATCHAGLNYAGAPIALNGEVVALIVAGQCYADPPDAQEEAERISRLAREYDLDPAALADAARELRRLDERTRTQLSGWLKSVAHTFRDIGNERTQLMGRLRTIAAMSMIDPV
jgi:excisionase family DNA binding protein